MGNPKGGGVRNRAKRPESHAWHRFMSPEGPVKTWEHNGNEIVCGRCGNARHVMLYQQQRGGGGPLPAFRCMNCDEFAISGRPYFPLDEVTICGVPARTVWPYAPGYEPYPPSMCGVCGKTAHVAVHHLAPRAVFGEEEAERWPTVSVCDDCHDRWHRKMREKGLTV